ncbi:MULTISPECIES: hypothetical protein [Natrialbaceae]|uniref:hypothetical protein n=1 Tax=Natrialbaceae TaxID=1644061 RepID=UPI00207C44A1|nr:hypothetical protein [Natronococcus sp. CG52]
MKRTRQSRRLLQATGGVAATALVAGCGGPDEEAEDPETGDEGGAIEGGEEDGGPESDDDEGGGIEGGDDEPESEEGTGQDEDE